MSHDGQSILDEYKSLTRKRAVAWDAYIRFNLVTNDDVRKFKAVDQVPRERRIAIVDADVQGYANLVLGVLRRSANENRADLVQYILMWTGDLLDGQFPPLLSPSHPPPAYTKADRV